MHNWEEKIEVNTNGLGTLLYREEEAAGDKNSNRKYVYFLPKTGVHITKILKHTKTRNEYHYKEITVKENEQDDEFFFEPSNSSDKSFPANLRPAVKLGFEFWTDEYAGTVFENEYTLKTYTFTIQGEQNQIDFTLIGGNFNLDGNTENTCYSYVTERGHQQVVCFVNDSEQHSFTNMIAFDSQYSPGEDNLPQHFINIKPGFGDNWVDTTTTQKNTAYPVLNLSSDIDTCFYRNFQNTSDIKVKSIWLYVDCFFEVYCSNYGYQEIGTEDEQKLARTKEIYTVSARINDAQVANATLSYKPNPNDQLSTRYYFYPNKKRVILDDDEQEFGSRMIPNNIANSMFPMEHKWIEFCRPSYADVEPISRHCNYVVLVNKGDQVKLGAEGKIKGFSPYMRFTDYWLLSTGKTLKTLDVIPESQMKNTIIRPIFKPYAECDLIIIDEGSGPFSHASSDPFTHKLHSIYDKYRKYWYINASENVERDRKLFEMYIKTISPYKNEFYLAHGCRNEYDASIPDSGHSKIGIGTSYDQSGDIRHHGLTETGFSKRHESCKYWWDKNYLDDPCLGVYIASCFGGGMQPEVQRPELGNTICQSSDDLIPQEVIPNVFYLISAQATHTTCGEKTHGMALYSLVKKGVDTGSSYKDFADYINNTILECTQQTYQKIGEFYETNFQDMLDLLPDDATRTMWLETREKIRQDIIDCGKMYFCRDNHVQSDNNYNLSSNYFFNNPNKYVIHDGFIGLIKQEIFYFDCQDYYERTFFDESRISSLILGKYEQLKTKLEKLKTDIQDIWRPYSEPGCEDILSACTFQQPVCGYSGKYDNPGIGFMKNPVEGWDKWFTSDNDLEERRQQSMTNG